MGHHAGTVVQFPPLGPSLSAEKATKAGGASMAVAAKLVIISAIAKSIESNSTITGIRNASHYRHDFACPDRAGLCPVLFGFNVWKP
jgi:hypothetical protein